jgi:hypothetical protein
MGTITAEMLDAIEQEQNDRAAAHKADRDLLDQMLQDVLDGVAFHYGDEGLQKVSAFAVNQYRAREGNRVMDELEKMIEGQ